MHTHTPRAAALRAAASSVLALALALPPLPLAAAAGDARAERAARVARADARSGGRLLVKFKPGVTRARRAAAGARIGYAVVREYPHIGWVLVRAHRGTSPSAAASRLRSSGLVTAVELDAQATLATATSPSDPLFSQQWALENIGQAGGTPDADIDATAAWSRSTGSTDVVVAVVDTGADLAHPDLAANAWVNTGEIPGNNVDDDDNGYVDDINGWDFNNGDATVFDPEQGDKHGTHVSGIVGAVGDNGMGVTGVNQHVRLMSCKFIDNMSGPVSAAVEGILYAVDNGATIINHSWSTSSFVGPLQDSIAYAASKGVINVAAAANSSVNIDSSVAYPASFVATNLISVAATTRDDALASFSNYGPTRVHVGAPGKDITSTLSSYASALYVERESYKVSYLAFAAESIVPTSSRDALIAASTGLVAPPGSPVLLVDDSHSATVGDQAGARAAKWLAALNAAGYADVTTWNTQTQGIPGAPQFDGRAVVWFTGRVGYYRYSVEALDGLSREAIARYLDSGGRLVLSSGEAGWDLDGQGLGMDWYRGYLRARVGAAGSEVGSMYGSAGGPLAGSSFELAQSAVVETYTSGSARTWYPENDDVVAIDGSAAPIFDWRGYVAYSGTSMAAPLVAGALALYRAAYPDAGAAESRIALESSVDTISALVGKTTTGGRLNVGAMLGMHPEPPAIVTPRRNGVLRAGSVATVTVSARASAAPASTYEVQIGTPTELITNGGFEAGSITGFSGAGTVAGIASDLPGEAFTGRYGMRSAPIVSNQTSGIMRTVTVPPGGGEVSFRLWLDSEDEFDYVQFTINGRTHLMAMRDTSWTEYRFPLSAGATTLVWLYRKDFAGSEGRDAFGLDDVSVTSYAWSSSAAVNPSTMSATVTVPAASTDAGVVRARGVLADKPSQWESVRVRYSTDITATPAPTGFTAVAGTNGDAALSWTDPVATPDWVSTRLVRRVGASPTGPDDGETVYEGRAGAASDAGLSHGADVRYALFARDYADNWSSASTASMTAVDVVAPPKVAFLQAARAGDDVRVTWLAPSATDVAGVRLVRRSGTAPAGAEDPAATWLSDSLGPLVVDTDAAVATETVLHYAAYAYDGTPNYSPAAVATIAIDTLAPSGTFALAGGTDIVTTRTVSANSAVSGAIEMRFDTGTGFSAWVPYAASTPLVLPVTGANIVLAEYRDAAGNVFSASDSVYVITSTARVRSTVAIRRVYQAYGKPQRFSVSVRDGVSLAPISARVAVQRSYDGGATWTTVATPLTGGAAVTVSVTVSRPARIRAVFGGDSGYSGSTSAVLVAKPLAALSAPAAPTAVTRGSAFYVSGKLWPRHAAGTQVILRAYRYESGRWVLRKSVTAKTWRGSTYSAYRYGMRLAAGGRWRIMASHADAFHGWSRSPYTYVTVR